MTGSLSDIKKRNFSKILCLFGLLMITLFSQAQRQQALPDSISVDTTFRERAAAPPADTTAVSDGGNAADTVKTDTADRSRDDGSRSQVEYAPDSVIFRSIPADRLGKYRSDPDFEYANDPRYWQKEEPDQPTAFDRFLGRLLSSAWLKWFAYALLIGLIVFAIYKIVAGNRLYLFYKPSKAVAGAVEEEGGDIYDEDLEVKINEAIGRSDYRMAIRYLFLNALRLLNDKDLIRFNAQSTNQEYADQLNDDPRGKDFKFLAYAYEHVWYGERPLAEEQFRRLMTDFRDFYSAVNGNHGR